MAKIPLVKPDLPAFDALEGGLREILENGKITNFGKYVGMFEAEAGAFLQSEVATVPSGTAGLILALQALGLEAGAKVVLPSFTFMATAQAALYAGGVPVFADVGSDLTLSAEDLDMLLSRHKDVALVLPVHTFGLPADVEAIQAVVDRASKHSSRPIALLYDAAPAFGSARGKRRVGTFGDAEVFSLSATKLLVSVEGGMISSRNSAIIERIRHTRNYGIGANYDARWPGLNGKMSEFHALIGLHNLRRLPSLLDERRSKARYYLDSIQAQTDCEVLPTPADVTHTFKDLTVLVPESQADRRDDILALLRSKDIETRTYFNPPLHKQQLFQRYADRPLPRTESMARRVITLPFFTAITETDMDYVVRCLAEAQSLTGSRYHSSALPGDGAAAGRS